MNTFETTLLPTEEQVLQTMAYNVERLAVRCGISITSP